MRNDFRDGEQCRGVAGKVPPDAESERGASPAAPVIGAGEAVAPDPFGIAETGDVIGSGKFRRKIPGRIWKRNIICTTLEGLAKIKESDEHDGL